MKNKILIVFLTIIFAACLSLGLAACGDDEIDYDGEKEGTYYLVTDGIIDESNYIILDEERSGWVFSNGESGDYWVSSMGTFYFHTEYKILFTTGYEYTAKFDDDGILTIELDGETLTYRHSKSYVSYTVSYNANGGSLAYGTVPIKVIKGTKLTLSAPDNPVNDGYDFLGWTTDLSTKEIYEFGTVTVKSDIVLYAVWQGDEFTITYIADGVTVDTLTYEAGDVTVDGEPEVPSKLGYTGEWQTYALGSGNITVYAVYTPVIYFITYSETNGAANNNPITYDIESNITLSSLSANGYSFLGWYNGDTKVTKISSGTTGNITLTARWQAITYSITYQKLNGNSSDSFITSYTIESETIILPVNLTAEGYTFNGWLDENGSAVTSINTGSYGNRVFTADFSPVTYTINYRDTRSVTNPNPASYTVEDDTIFLTSLTLEGYTFLGWYNGDTRVTQIASGSTGDLTLTAKWEATVYTITYNNTKEADTSAFVTSYTIESGTITLPAGLTSTASEFLGWVDESGNAVTQISSGSTGNVTFTAKWQLETYTITYSNLQGAENTNVSTYTADDDITLAELTRNGYTFLGWYNGDTKVTQIASGSTGDLTLTAKWEATVYTITYNNTKEADTSAFVTSYTIESETITLPTGLTSTASVFLGWVDGSGNAITQISSGSTGNVTVTASWQLETYTITYTNLQGATNGNPSIYTIDDEITLVSAELGGYDFLGWADESGNAVTKISSGSTGNITLTASWELATYTITYENTYEADTSGYTTTYTINSETIVLPTDLTVGGYTFNGWLDEDGNAVTQIASGSYGNKTLYADLTPTTYVITLEAFSGTISKTTYTVYYGESFTLAVPTLKGYSFTGWYTNTGSSGTQITDENGSSLSSWSYSTSRILYAHYTAKTYTITFDPNGGTLSAASQKYSYGSTFDPDSITCTYESFQFLGWYTSSGEKYTSSTLITTDVKLYAQWLYSTAISTADELIAIAEDPTANYHLTCDINLKGNIWTPIEEYSGTLLGYGYRIYNFILQTTSQSSYGFIITNNGTVDGIKFDNFTFTTSVTSGDNYFGVIAAVNNGTISNCSLNSGLYSVTLDISYYGTITYYSYCGIVVGENNGSIVDCCCYVDMAYTISVVHSSSPNRDYNVYEYFYCGGIAGNNNGSISGCTGSMSASINRTASGAAYYGRTGHAFSYNYIGGIVGINSGEISQSSASLVLTGSSSVGSYAYEYIVAGGFAGVNAGTIEDSGATGSINIGSIYNPEIGGFIGENTDVGSAKSCYSTIDVTHTEGSGSVGGFVGYNSGIVQNSYASGNIISAVAGSVGGFVGHNTSSGSVTKCYSSGSVTAADSDAGYFVGTSEGTLFKCYYLTTSMLFVNGEQLSYVVEYTTVEGISGQTLWSTEFLVGELYWEEESWIVVLNGDPLLDWEMYVGHSYTETVVEATCEDIGYTVYVCNDCGLFFVRNLVEAYGHSYGEGTVVAPTCTVRGYTEYVCTICGHIHQTDLVDALGHTYCEDDLIERIEPTCTKEGYETYECSVCHNHFTIILEPLGHTEYVSKEGQSATCYCDTDGEFHSAYGWTEEISCSVCDEVLQESEKIEPHSYIITVIDDQYPTCTEDGYGIYTCEYPNCGFSKEDTIPATGHTDSDGNHICDTCGAYLGYEDQEVTVIDSVDKFIAIADNLSGVYRLDADIDLTSYNLNGFTWTPVGTADAPFTGCFDGNGHTITSPYINCIDGYCGLFGYNKGVICNVTIIISGDAFFEQKVGVTVGIIAAHNYGVVTCCTVEGSIRYTATATTVVDLSGTTTYYTLAFGCVVGQNYYLGSITNCLVTAKLTLEVTNYLEITQYNSVNALGNKLYLNTQAATLTVSVGLICGINSGEVTGCSVTDDNTSAYAIIRVSNSFSDWEEADYNRIGMLTATSKTYYGRFVGANAGTVSGCTGYESYSYGGFGTSEGSGRYYKRYSYSFLYIDGVQAW